MMKVINDKCHSIKLTPPAVADWYQILSNNITLCWVENLLYFKPLSKNKSYGLSSLSLHEEKKKKKSFDKNDSCNLASMMGIPRRLWNKKFFSREENF